MKVSPPKSREVCTHPQRVTFLPASERRNSPQVFVRSMCSKYIWESEVKQMCRLQIADVQIADYRLPIRKRLPIFNSNRIEKSPLIFLSAFVSAAADGKNQ